MISDRSDKFVEIEESMTSYAQTDPAENRDAGDSEFLFGSSPIAPASLEFRRLYEKKLRSFEKSEDQEQIDAYRKAIELGEKKIAQRLAGGETC